MITNSKMSDIVDLIRGTYLNLFVKSLLMKLSRTTWLNEMRLLTYDSATCRDL